MSQGGSISVLEGFIKMICDGMKRKKVRWEESSDQRSMWRLDVRQLGVI